jgi:hypothetical protein
MSKRRERRVTNQAGLHYLQGPRYDVIALRSALPTRLHEPLRWHTVYQVRDRWTDALIGAPSENEERIAKLAKRCNREGRP